MPVARLLRPSAAGFAARVALQRCIPIASAWLVRGSRLARVLSSAAAGASTSAAGEENLEFLMDVLKESIGVTGVSWCRGLWCACLLMLLLLTRACSDSVRACARVMTLRVLRRSCSGD